MALLVGELYALLILEKRAFLRGLKEAEAAAAASGNSIQASLVSAGKIVAVGLGLAAIAAVAIGYESVQAAAKFQSAMKMVQTQAGASAKEVKMLTEGILGMAGATGTGPDALAEGIYHIESAGIRGARALDVLKTAALGAKMGNADLEAVTNALIAEVNSGIPGIHNMSEAMGALNGIVGNGNMRMNDLALSMSTGILSVAKTFGVSMQSLGAAIATMTDQGVPAVDAATKLKSAIISIASPIGATKKAFKSIGLDTRMLAEEMKSPRGLVGALSMLKQHMDAAGLDAVEQGQLIANAFGKRGGPAVMLLLNSLGLVAQKEQAIGKAAGDFATNVSAMMETTAFKASQVGADLGVIAVQIGDAILPAVNDALAGIHGFLSGAGIQTIFKVLAVGFKALGAVIGGVAAAIGFVVGVLDKLGMIGPLVAAVVGAIAIAFGAWAVSATIAAVSTVVAFAPVIAVLLVVAAAVKVLDEVFKLFGTDLIHVVGGAVNIVVGIFKGFIGTFLNVAETIVGVLAALPSPLQDQAKSLQNTLHDMRMSVDSWGVDIVGAVGDIGTAIGGAFTSNLGKSMGDTAASFFKTAAEKLGASMEEGVASGALGAQGMTNEQMKALGLTADASLANGIDENGNLVGDATAKLTDKFGFGLSGVIKAAKSAGADAMTEMAKGISDHRNAPLDAFDTLKDMLKHSMSIKSETAKLMGELISKDLAKGLKDKRPDVRAQAIGTKQMILDRLAEIAPSAKTLGKKGMDELKKAMKSKDKDIAGAARDIYNTALGKGKGTGPADLPSAAHGFGANMSKQLAAGILSAIGKVINAAQAAAQAVFDNLFTHSPAKSGPLSRGNGPEGWGANIGKGFAKGLAKTMPNVSDMLGGDMQMPSFESITGGSLAPQLAMAASAVGGSSRDNSGMLSSSSALIVSGGIHLHGVGNDVTPAAAERFSQRVLDTVAEGFQQQAARRGLQQASRP